MKHLILLLCASLALSACSALSPAPLSSVPAVAASAADAAGVPAPVVAADQTVLDEKALLALEHGYKLTWLAGIAATDAGAIKGDAARRLMVLDNKAFLALAVARSAWRAGNAANYAAAIEDGKKALAELRELTGN